MFKRGDKVRIKGVKDLFEISHMEFDSEIGMYSYISSCGVYLGDGKSLELVVGDLKYGPTPTGEDGTALMEATRGFQDIANRETRTTKDNINPSHYKTFSKETFEMMIDIWGPIAFKKHCEMTAFKYRMRAGYKDDPLQDLEKAKWYENKVKEL
jgi:hypothetical protein